MLKSETKIGYALALLDIAKEEKKINEIYNHSYLVLDVLEKENKLEQILDSYQLNDDSKKLIIEKSFKGIHWSLINTMVLLSYKIQFKNFRDIIRYLITYLQDILKIERGIVYSTKLLSSETVKKLENKLYKQLNKKIKLENFIDKELIGGFKIQIGSMIIEDSIKSELLNMKKNLKLNKGGV